MPDPEPDFEAILKALAGAGVEFIVVGGVCAVLHGAPSSRSVSETREARCQLTTRLS